MHAHSHQHQLGAEHTTNEHQLAFDHIRIYITITRTYADTVGDTDAADTNNMDSDVDTADGNDDTNSN